MKKRIFIALILILMLVPTFIAQAHKPAPSLIGTTEYYFVGDLGIFDAEGRLLAWEGPISGDIEGVIQWWMVMGPITGQVSHFEARWEIWDGADLLLAGTEAGTTTNRPGKNGVWRAHGFVTEAVTEFEDWIGRPIHDGGEFIWVIPGVFPSHGWGELRIN